MISILNVQFCEGIQALGQTFKSNEIAIKNDHALSAHANYVSGFRAATAKIICAIIATVFILRKIFSPRLSITLSTFNPALR